VILTDHELAIEHRVEYETRRGMGWSHEDALRAANEHRDALRVESDLEEWVMEHLE
jgi:hypothetical protein